MDNPYVLLTEEFNRGRLRALLSSGQAVVLYRLAIMSKDGDWILREDDEALGHVRGVLAGRDSCYRFGAPLDLRWHRHGWSSHLEHRSGLLRVRTDFVTRPPRIDPDRLAAMWKGMPLAPVPIVGLEDLVEIKKTNREKDYAVIGELARLIHDPTQQLLHSRSARDILSLVDSNPDSLAEAAARRPLLMVAAEGRERLEQALDEERRGLMRANEERLARYLRAAEAWAAAWPGVQREIDGLPLPAAHEIVTARAERSLPFSP
jgi:hypothetical protein